LSKKVIFKAKECKMNYKTLKTFLLFAAFLLATNIGFAEKTEQPVSVQIADADLIDKTADQVQRLSLLTKPGKYFLDKKPDFIIELPLSLIPPGARSMSVDVGGDVFHLDGVAPIYIKGLTAGEPEISIELLNEAGEPLEFKKGTTGSLELKIIARTPVFKHDAIVLGILLILLALVFWTEKLKVFRKFYRFVPALLLCYFLPSFLNSGGLISGDYSNLYYVASRYLLPASLILLCISIDFKGILNLGPKALVMFLTATLGIVLGGPIALLVILKFAPGMIVGEPIELANGLSTIAGSWIGGGANQTAMKEIFEVKDKIFSSMIVVDVVVANIWMGFLLYGANISDKLDLRLKADNSAIKELRDSVENYRASIEQIPTTTNVFIMMAVAFGGVALSHWGASVIVPFMENYEETLRSIGLQSLLSSFFWLIVISTTYGLILSFTRARKLEGVGASRWGSVFIYVLVATIGMKMNILEIFNNLGLFAIGFIWMLIHVSLLLLVAKLIRAPFFFVAVGSQANIGGAASAPIVAAAFSPALAPVGVLMAVLGYALGTYGALLCQYLMAAVAGG
jgi:uncharacterized membrane protein